MQVDDIKSFCVVGFVLEVKWSYGLIKLTRLDTQYLLNWKKYHCSCITSLDCLLLFFSDQ